MFSRPFLIVQAVFLALGLTLYGAYQYRLSLANRPPVYGPVGDFTLQDQDHQNVSLTSLKGHVWVADFIFTTCSGICPMMTKNMGKISQALSGFSGLRLVSISVNPENDTPEALKAYAKKVKADGRWLFLTGPRETIQNLALESFKMGDMKDIVFHSSLFALVDRKGMIRGYYDGTDEERMARLITDVGMLRNELSLPLWPTINASLNGLAGVSLVAGFWAIRRRKIALHRKLMLTAFGCSILFLCCYVYYHATSHLITKYQGQGLWRAVYFFVLGTHTPLAIGIVPFILMALRHAFRGEFEQHMRITRKLFPAWLYVSVTGVVIYLMLYVFRPA